MSSANSDSSSPNSWIIPKPQFFSNSTYATKVFPGKRIFNQKLQALVSLWTLRDDIDECYPEDDSDENSVRNTLLRPIFSMIVEIRKYKARRSSQDEIQNIRKFVDVEMKFIEIFRHGIFKKLIKRKIACLVDKNHCKHGESLKHRKCCVHGLCCRHLASAKH